MRGWMTALMICCSGAASGTDSSKEAVQQALKKADFLQAESLLLEALEQADDLNKGELLTELAVTYYRDQKDELSFKTFMRALDYPSKSTFVTPSSEELDLAEKAFHLYTSPKFRSQQQMSQSLLYEFMPAMQSHSDYHILNFFIASAYGNLGNFEELFRRFFTSYSMHPDSYMAYKTKAAIAIRLLERSKTDEDRENWRQLVIANAEKALERNVDDISLFKILIVFTTSEGKPQIVAEVLKTILDEDIKVSRTDLPFFVQAGLDFEAFDLADRLVQRAGQWYRYSRAVSKLVDQLKEHEQNQSLISHKEH